MKSFTLLTILLISSNLLKAQEDYKKIALDNAKAMIEAMNENDYVRYADFLTPEQYPFEDKTLYYETWKGALNHNTRIVSNLKLERFGFFDNTQQAFFSCKFGDRKSSFFGISTDAGKSWYFTQFIGKFNYDQIRTIMMSQLDSSFTDLDPNYTQRISFNIGELIHPFEYEDINGNYLKSEQLKGKVIVLNFWSTSCAPCIKEIPDLNKLVDKMDKKNVVFIAPVFNSSKNEVLNSFLAKHPFSYKIVTLNSDDYNISALPTHIIIDKNQKVIGKFIGSSTENLKNIELLIEQ